MSTEIKHSERAHARLSASGSDRWINCPASPALEENFPEETSGYAEEGTLAHEFAERMLKVDLRLMPMNQYRAEIEELKKDKHYYYEIQNDVMPYVKYVIEQFTEAKRIDPKAKMFIERKFSLEKYVKGGFGTSDDAILHSEFLEIIDLKFGKGKEVIAKQNPQLKYYALGVLESLTPAERKKIKGVKLTIVQPRMDNINSWTIPADMLIKWGQDVLVQKALDTENPDAEAKAGDWCQFCKARAKCKALYDLGMEIARQDFDILEDPRALNDEQFMTAYKNADFIKRWCEDVKATALKEALNGKKWAGLKVVEGTSRRSFPNEEKVIEVLEENLYGPKDYFNQKLKGLGELTSLLGKKDFDLLLDPLAVKPKGAPTLVDESDKRKEYFETSLADDFDDGFFDIQDFNSSFDDKYDL